MMTPMMNDDDEDSNTAGATPTRHVTCVRGAGPFAGARAVSSSICLGVDTSAHRKNLNVVNYIPKDNERDETRDASSRNAAINACDKGQNSKRVIPPAMGEAIPPATMPQFVPVRRDKIATRTMP